MWFQHRVRRRYEKELKKLLHDAIRLHTGGQQRMPVVDQSNKGRHITFENEEDEVEEYVAIIENEITTNVGKEKSHKRPKKK